MPLTTVVPLTTAFATPFFALLRALRPSHEPPSTFGAIRTAIPDPRRQLFTLEMSSDDEGKPGRRASRLTHNTLRPSLGAVSAVSAVVDDEPSTPKCTELALKKRQVAAAEESNLTSRLAPRAALRRFCGAST